jgi:hypothetical protein
MDRIVEKRAAKDGDYRAVLEKNGRPLLSHGRSMSDDALLAKLHSLGLDSERQTVTDLL